MSKAQWRIRGGRDIGSAPFLVAGIVNATPDSFSDGGLYAEPQKAVAHAARLAAEGAHILDIGGESTRPGAALVSGKEEFSRVLPVVIGALALRADPAVPSPVVAVDTWRADTAQAVLDAGAHMINDISGASFDPAMAEILAHYKPGYVLMHTPAPPASMQRHTGYTDVAGAVLAFLERQMALLVRAGLPESHIALDPGIGFGKTPEQNLELMRQIGRLQTLGRPLYIGLSRKSFLGPLLGLPVEARDAATQTATALLFRAGVLAHRVHDVAGAVRALQLAEALAQL